MVNKVTCRCPNCFTEFCVGVVKDATAEELNNKCYYTKTKQGWVTGCRKRINYSPYAGWILCPYCGATICDKLQREEE